jgi:hypothetical protein
VQIFQDIRPINESSRKAAELNNVSEGEARKWRRVICSSGASAARIKLTFCCGYEEKQITCLCSGATSSLIEYLLPQLYHRYVM